MPRQHDYNPTEVSGITSLRTLAEREDLQASDKPVFATTFGDEDGEYRISTDESPARAHATQLDDWKLVYNQETGTIFDVVTDDYEVINPPEFIGALCDELESRERGDITGTVFLRDDGGAAYGQLLFADTHTIFLPGRGRSDPLRCGFELTWSHDSGMSVNVKGYAQDTACQNSIREITSPVHVKHAGDVDGRVNWHEEWATVLDQMGAFSENLAEIVEEALEYTFWDLHDGVGDELLDSDEAIPDEWLEQTDPLDTLGSANVPGPLTERDRDGFHAFYELLGFPRYIATGATERLLDELRQQDDPRVVSAWRAYSALTYSLTHAYRGSAVNTDDKFRRANDILLNPAKAKQEAAEEARERASPDDGRPMFADAEAEAAESTGDALRQYSERARELDQTFTSESDD